LIAYWGSEVHLTIQVAMSIAFVDIADWRSPSVGSQYKARSSDKVVYIPIVAKKR